VGSWRAGQAHVAACVKTCGVRETLGVLLFGCGNKGRQLHGDSKGQDLSEVRRDRWDKEDKVRLVVMEGLRRYTSLVGKV